MRALALSAFPALLLSALFCVAIAGCDGAKADAGLDAMMQVDGAQFYRGGMPAAQNGPAVASVNLVTSSVFAGQIGKSLTGAVAADATGAAIALNGDVGYWIVPAGLPDVNAREYPTYKGVLSFSRALRTGTQELVVRAVDASGNFGAPSFRDLSVAGVTVPTGKVVVSLTWDTESDLDLYVVDPMGVEISKRDINSYIAPPPGKAGDPNAWMNGGILDDDSNADCVIDGRRAENVVWAKVAPSGHYVVRVDTPSLCAAVSAHWTVEAFAGGVSLGRAQGSSFEPDTEFPHDRGAGVLAMEFDVP